MMTGAVSVAAVTAAAGLAIAGTAIASSPAARPQPTPRPTTLAIDGAKTVIKLGQKDIITGRLMTGKKGLGKEMVILDRVQGTKLVPVRADLTNSAGNVLFKVRPKVTTQYELVFAGTAKLAASHSKVITVKARH
jgi:hypothetical protein